ncbi:MAG: PPC domain-containing protein [Anaerolineae bacterium]|nr:PPC domain-containing protein [Anaerolineae bacterium]
MIKRICLVSLAIVIAGGVIWFWDWGLGHSQTIAATLVPPAAPTEDSWCVFQAITVTAADLGVTPGISDTWMGSPESRLIYFANWQSGVLTVTAALSEGAATDCYLWGGAAFDQMAAEFIPGAGNTYWLTYPVSAGLTALLPTPLVVTSSWFITGTMSYTLSRQARLTLTRDITPPQVSLTVPTQISATAFTVAWAAYDAQSGVVSWTLAYSGTGHTDWQTWVTDTEQVSATFHVPTVPGDYRFHIMACDHVGNCASMEKVTRVAPIHIYLPLTLRNWVWWYAYDPYEPNDTPQQAYGPLVLGQKYTAYIWDASDKNDWYRISGTGGDVAVTLEVPDNSDLDLYIYVYENGQYDLEVYSNQYGLGVDEAVSLGTSEGTVYYIRVYPYLVESDEHLPYHLGVETTLR